MPGSLLACSRSYVCLTTLSYRMYRTMLKAVARKVTFMKEL